MHPSVTLIRDIVDSLGRRDLKEASTLIAEDCIFHVPGRSAISGHHRGKEAVVGHMIELAELTRGTFRIDDYDVVANDAHAVGIYQMSAEYDGKRFTWQQVNLYHVRDGKVCEVWQHPSDPFEWDSFWSQLEV